MSRWKEIGKYLGRTIKTAEVSMQAPIQFESIETSVLLLLLRETIPLDSVRTLIKALIGQQPMAIVVHGIHARAAFEFLMFELNEGSSTKHVMTKLLEDGGIDSAIEDLLHATWPSEDRFDDWSQYAIVSVGGGSQEVEEVVRKLCG